MCPPFSQMESMVSKNLKYPGACFQKRGVREGEKNDQELFPCALPKSRLQKKAPASNSMVYERCQEEAG